MKWTDIIILPFVFIYRGFMSILLIPYYIVSAIMKKSNKKNTIPEIKKGEKIKVVKGVRSAYDTPNKPKVETDPIKLKKERQKNIKQRQKYFDKMVEKARQEEIKKVKEQEKLRIENEKREKEKQKRELEKQKREDAIEAERDKREEALRAKGKPVTFFEKLRSFYKKITYNPKVEIELEAKKAVLDEQFKDSDDKTISRLSKPILFQYIARNPKGEIEKSTIEALSRVDVHSFLLAEGYEVYDITAAKAKRNIITYKMKKSKLIFFLSQLSAYLKSGISLAEAVKILEEQTKKLNDKKVWKALYYDLSMGDVLSVAMEKRKDTFPKLLINMVKTAEMTGNLTETLDDMVEYYTESESTKKQMKSALTYPAVILVFAIIVVAYILLFTIPSFANIYKSMDADLPSITTFILNLSDFLQNHILIILFVIILVCIAFIFAYRNSRTFRRNVQELTMHIPVFGDIIIYNEVTIFAKTFANLINHNIFITDSMDVLSKITNNEIYKKLIYDTAKNLNKGDSISKAFKDHWAFPVIAYQMLITGEKTGRLGPMMERVSEYFQEQHRSIINQMKALIEPVIIVFLAVVVGGILLAVIVPMFGMYSSMQ